MERSLLSCLFSAAGVLAFCLMAAIPARADIVAFLSGTQAVPGGTRFTYDIRLTSGQSILLRDPPASVIIYDFPGLVGGATFHEINPTVGLGVETQLFGITPAGAVVTDDPAVTNIRIFFVAFNSSSVITDFGPQGTGLALVSFVSSFSGINPNGQFAAQAFEGTTLTTNTGMVAVPAAVPEPATMLLLGTGLAGVAARVRGRRKE